MTEAELRTRITDVMRSWLGRCEADGSHRPIIDLYNRQSELPRGYRMTYRDAWCAATITAASIQAGLEDIIPAECGCNDMIRLFRSMDRWQEDDSFVPGPGDIIFYDWQDDGEGENTGASEHVGMVEQVRDACITVIEGNRRHAVRRRKLPTDGRYIRGFGLPDYRGKAIRLSVTELAELGILNSPDYWISEIMNGQLLWLDALMEQAAGVLRKAGPRSETPEEGLLQLTAAGIINTPDYWRSLYPLHPNLSELLKALGGAAASI